VDERGDGETDQSSLGRIFGAKLNNLHIEIVQQTDMVVPVTIDSIQDRRPRHNRYRKEFPVGGIKRIGRQFREASI